MQKLDRGEARYPYQHPFPFPLPTNGFTLRSHRTCWCGGTDDGPWKAERRSLSPGIEGFFLRRLLRRLKLYYSTSKDDRAEANVLGYYTWSTKHIHHHVFLLVAGPW